MKPTILIIKEYKISIHVHNKKNGNENQVIIKENIAS